MHMFVSLLRGINVTGYHMVSMPRLRELYESLRLEGVRTYIQSGNVVFGSARDDPEFLKAEIERAIERTFGFDVPVVLRRAAELRKVIRANPFLGRDGVDEGRLYVTFLERAPSKALVNALAPVTVKSKDDYEVLGKEIYLHCPHGYGKTLLSTTFFEKHLKIEATNRNWKTVQTLLAMVDSSPT